MPIAFDTSKGNVNKYLTTRIYSVIGGNDRRRNIGKSKSFFEKLTKQGGNDRPDVENSWGHGQTCEWSFICNAKLGITIEILMKIHERNAKAARYW